MKTYQKIFITIFLLLSASGIFAQGTWVRKADYPGAQDYEGTTFVIGDKIYVCAGDAVDPQSNPLWQFDPLTNVWTQLADFSGVPRQGAVSFSAMNKGFVGLGASDFGSHGFANDFWAYDPLLNQWNPIASFPGAPMYEGVGFSIDNKGYVGLGSSLGKTNEFWEYNLTNNSWTPKADYPATYRTDAIAFNIGDKGYVGTGFGGGPTSDFFQYDPVNNKWTRKANVPIGRYGAFAFSIGAKGYLGTGVDLDCDCYSKSVWVYNPTVDVWARVADFGGVARYLANGVAVNGKGYGLLGSDDQGIPSVNDIWEYTPDNLTEQKITFPAISPKLTNSPDFNPGATATSNLPVTYKSGDLSVATIVNNKVHIVRDGSVYITASQGGNASYRLAFNVSQLLTFVAPHDDAYLSNLAISNGLLAPAFSLTNNSYKVSVGNATKSVAIIPTVDDTTATVKVNGITTVSGKSSNVINLNTGSNIIKIVVTAQDSTTIQHYTINITRASINNATLSQFKISRGILTPVFSPGTTSYTANVVNGVTSFTITPAATDANANIKINGTIVSQGTTSAPLPLSVGTHTIYTKVTAEDGVTTKTYILSITRAASNNANLSLLKMNAGVLSPAFSAATTSYTSTVSNGISSVKVTPITVNGGAIVTVNGTNVTSGSPSGAIALGVGANTITVHVTAQDGATQNTYTIVITRAASSNASLAALTPTVGSLSPAFASATAKYTLSEVNSQSSIKLTPTAADPTAIITLNGTAVLSGTSSAAISLNVGTTTITTVVTAQNGTTTKTYTITVTRAASINTPNESLSVDQPAVSPPIDNDGIIVHQGISPNGDGINDYLVIDGILAYPDNNLSVINRNGALVFEAKGYDNASKVFDGHSNKTGQMQLPGTYFYSLDYTVNGIIKHKTGYIVLKY